VSEFEIVTLKSGIKSLRSLHRKETFHPTTGPLGEANLLHVEQQRLLERCSKAEKFVIWDVGFGAGANVLAAIESLKSCRTEVEIHSFDKTTDPIEFALSHASELGYILGHEEKIRELLFKRKLQVGNQIQWYLHLGDFSEQIKGSQMNAPAPNTIFYDPYSAASNPEMWTLEHFSALWNKLSPNTGCLLTNYTRSTAVRVALLLAGFYVGVGRVVGEKAETTVASNQIDMLECPLDRTWLGRVRNSTNAAPLRTQSYSKAQISHHDFECLQKLPQFSSYGTF
jgi:tRNA U34 5-methylaminomethyl-2-thiouridine-forming methyltransferase MnmC